MHVIDWFVVVIAVCTLGVVAFGTKRYANSAASFLAANRSAGRYLLTMAEGTAGFGAISIIAEWQRYYEAGFSPLWWWLASWPIFMCIAMSGWIVYRYRQTRALTMAQFFEMRYSKNFRIFAGAITVLSGVINYGIFPAVEARFFIYFCGLERHIVSLGFMNIDLTMFVVMSVILGISLIYTIWGGQISVIITDFLQGQFLNIVFLLVLIVLFMNFKWDTIVATLQTSGPGRSMLNPFDQQELANFALPFFIMSMLFNTYCYMAWQGSQSCYCSAKNAHEARMSRIVSIWRYGVQLVVLALAPVCAYVLLHGSVLAEKAAVANATFTTITDSHVKEQMIVPIALTALLPSGMLGLFCAMMIAASIAVHQACMLSWGSIFVQDVLMPLKKTPYAGPEVHLKYLRISIGCVAGFALLFSLIFPLKDYILMFQSLSGAIFLGGAGSVIIGGLYWKRGTSAGAWAAMSVGAVLAISGVLVKNVLWEELSHFLRFAHLVENIPAEFPLNGIHLACISAAAAIASYIIVSLFTKVKPGFDLNKMLHRDEMPDAPKTQFTLSRAGLKKLLGITSEFTRADKFLYAAFAGWNIMFMIIFIIGTILCVINKSNDHQWAKYWLFHLSFLAIAGIISTVWFMVCGFKDLAALFKALKTAKVDVNDNGSVSVEEISTAAKQQIPDTVSSKNE